MVTACARRTRRNPRVNFRARSFIAANRINKPGTVTSARTSILSAKGLNLPTSRTKSGNDDGGDGETSVQFRGALARTRGGLVSGTARRITSVSFLLLATIKRFLPTPFPRRREECLSLDRSRTARRRGLLRLHYFIMALCLAGVIIVI